MTEAEWLAASDPAWMLNSMGDDASERKLRLFAVACCYRVRCVFDSWVWGQVELAERCADGQGDLNELIRRRDDLAEADLPARGSRPAHFAAGNGPYRITGVARATGMRLNKTTWYSALDAVYAADHCARAFTRSAGASEEQLLTAQSEEGKKQSCLLREIFGNPFRPVVLDPAWRTPNAVALAETIYEERELPSGHLDRTRLAVLADALLDAGCDNEVILGHCKSEGPHVRGCWVVDLILRKG